MSEDKELEKIKMQKIKDMLDNATGESKPNLTDTPIKVTDASFSKIIKNNKLVIVDCWAQWCGPCRMVAPILDELAKEYAGRILIGKLNVDENRVIPTKYQIMSIPTLLVFKNEKLVERIVGAMPKQILETKITNYL
jgi:thioredoxin 1